MEQYYDAFVYVANWGSHEFMLRLPRTLLDPETAAHYCVEAPVATAHTTGEHVILSFSSEDEEGDFDEDGEEWMSALLPLRAELAAGDLRALYLAWLRCAQEELLDDEAIEPPVPPGLGDLSASLSAFVEFMRIDEDLLAVAAERSASLKETRLTAGEMERRLQALPDEEKHQLLLRLGGGQATQAQTELLRQLREIDQKSSATNSDGAGGRTAGELLTAAEEQTEARVRREEEQAARERARRAAEEAAARAAYLDGLATREEQTWRQVETMVETKRPKEYDQAVQLLKDLRDLAARRHNTSAFDARLRDLRARHTRQPALLDRMDRAGLGRV